MNNMKLCSNEPIKLSPSEPIIVYVSYEGIIQKINERIVDVDRKELEKVFEVLRQLDKEQRV